MNETTEMNPILMHLVQGEYPRFCHRISVGYIALSTSNHFPSKSFSCKLFLQQQTTHRLLHPIKL